MVLLAISPGQYRSKSRLVAFCKKGFGYRKISQRLHVAISSVCNIVKKFLVLGTVNNRQRSGRPQKINPRLGRKLNRIIKGNPRSAAQELVAVCANQGVEASRSTIVHHLNRAGLQAR